MTRSRRQPVSSRSDGFTLVELLVAMTIFVILVTLTVAGFRATVEADRDSNAVSNFRNALEGARSRAIKTGQIRGLRLIADANDPRMATSMIYVGSAGTEEGSVAVPHPADTSFSVNQRLAFSYFIGEVDTNGNGYWDSADDVDSDGINDRAGWYFRVWNNSTYFADLYTQGFLRAGNRIAFSSTANDEGTPKYTIRSIEYDANGNGSIDPEEDFNNNGFWDIQLVEFVEPYRTGNFSNSYDKYHQTIVNPAVGFTSTLYYRLELSPTILPGAEPIVLSGGYGIDLDGSRLPAGWRYVEDSNSNGQIDGSESDLNSSGMFEFSTGYSNEMDLLFTPDGALVGSLASEGVLHFVIAAVSDVSLFQSNTTTGRTRALGGSFPYGTGSTYPTCWLQTDAERGRKVLSLFTQSGGIVISDLYNPTGDTNGTVNDEYFTTVPNPFQNALLGLEAKR